VALASQATGAATTEAARISKMNSRPKAEDAADRSAEHLTDADFPGALSVAKAISP